MKHHLHVRHTVAALSIGLWLLAAAGSPLAAQNGGTGIICLPVPEFEVTFDLSSPELRTKQAELRKAVVEYLRSQVREPVSECTSRVEGPLTVKVHIEVFTTRNSYMFMMQQIRVKITTEPQVMNWNGKRSALSRPSSPFGTANDVMIVDALKQLKLPPLRFGASKEGA